jgi:hypothetical protein
VLRQCMASWQLLLCLQVVYRLWVSEDFEQRFLELEQRLSGCIVDLSAALHIKQ